MLKMGATVTVAMFVISLLLSGCANGGAFKAIPADQQVKLIFWDENAGPDRTPYLKELLRRFQEANPHISVEYVAIPNSSNKRKYDVAIASNNTPDVGGINAPWISDFVAKGALLPLDDFFDAWRDKNKITSSLVEYSRSLVPDLKLYQIPTTIYLDVFWYRTDWIRQAGLRPPTTWNDFFTDVVKLTDREKKRYGYSIRGGDGSINQLTSAMYAYSGIDRYFDGAGNATVNDPKHVEFLRKYVALYKTYTPVSDIASAYKEMVGTFDSGESGIIQHNFGTYHNHLKALGEGKFAATLLPKADNGKRIVTPFANGYGIFTGSKHPEEAWKLLSFLLSADSETYWNENIGQMPTNVDSLQSDYVKKTPYIQEGIKAMADINTVVLDVPIYLPDYNNIMSQQLEPNFQKVLSGTMSPEQFLNGWAAAIMNAKEDYDKILAK